MDFLNFICENIYYVFLVAIIVFQFAILLCMFVFKAGKVDANFGKLWQFLPIAIKQAEDLGISGGNVKLDYVVNLAITYLHSLTNKSVEYLSQHYRDLIITQVELILTTPERKENDI